MKNKEYGFPCHQNTHCSTCKDLGKCPYNRINQCESDDFFFVDNVGCSHEWIEVDRRVIDKTESCTGLVINYRLEIKFYCIKCLETKIIII